MSLAITLVIYSNDSLLGRYVCSMMLWGAHWIALFERIYLSLIEVSFKVISPTGETLVEGFSWSSISVREEPKVHSASLTTTKNHSLIPLS